MQTQLQNARYFTSVPSETLKEALSPTASSVLMELSSTSSISSVTGGSMWTALKRSHCTVLMMILQLRLPPSVEEKVVAVKDLEAEEEVVVVVEEVVEDPEEGLTQAMEHLVDDSVTGDLLMPPQPLQFNYRGRHDVT